MGDCTPIKCEPRNTRFDNCSSIVEEQYKFYISFENALCKEYVTEKLFVRLSKNVVPVVMGSGPYNNGITPPHSVIDFEDFDSPRELAQYLLWLDEHPEEYLSYFWWKDYYEAKPGSARRVACEICRKLHSQAEPRSVYKNLYKWWVDDAQCMTWSHEPLNKLWYKFRENIHTLP